MVTDEIDKCETCHMEYEKSLDSMSCDAKVEFCEIMVTESEV